MLEGKEKYSLKTQNMHHNQNKIWQKIGNYLLDWKFTIIIINKLRALMTKQTNKQTQP